MDDLGVPWLTDFGLAHLQHGEASLTMTGDLVGTLRYMSPEQALAKRVVIDQRTDVYSLGATLYELLALRPAFTGSDRQELLRQVAFDEPIAPRRLDRSIPAELETIVLKAMEKNPTDRYGTAQELADDLRRWLEDRPIKARRPSSRQRVVKWCRRHPAVMWAAGAVALVAVVALAVSTVVIWQAKQDTEEALGERTQALEKERKALEKEEKAHAKEREAREREEEAATLLRISAADLEWVNREPKRAERLLDACPTRLRRWEWHYLKRQCRKQRLQLPGQYMPLGFSADGQRLTCIRFTEGKIDVSIWDVTTRQKVTSFLSPKGMNLRNTGFSPDGQRMAHVADGQVSVWDVTAGRQLFTRPLREKGAAKTVASATWAWASPRLTVADFTLALWVAKSSITVAANPTTAVALSPDGRRLILASGKFGKGVDVHVQEFESGQVRHPLTDAPRVSAFSRNGRYAASFSGGLSKVWDMDTGKEVASFRTPAGQSVFSWDGAFYADQQMKAPRVFQVAVWEVRTGKVVGQFGGDIPLALSSDGKRLATRLEGKVVVWDIGSRRQICTVGSPKGGGLSRCWSKGCGLQSRRVVDRLHQGRGWGQRLGCGRRGDGPAL